MQPELRSDDPLKACSSIVILLLATGIMACSVHCASASPSEVVGPYIANPAQPISPWEEVTIVTNVTDFVSGTSAVTLFYSTDASAPRHYTSVPMTRVHGDQKQGSYLAQIPEQPNGTDIYFFTTIVDGSGNAYEMTFDERDPAHYRVMVFPSYFDIIYLGIEQVDPTELTADIRVTFRVYLPFQGEPPRNILVQLHNDFVDSRTVEVPLSGKYEYELQTDLKGLHLIGDASLYPFDRYNLDLNFTLFFMTASASYSSEAIYFARFSDNYVWQLRSTSTANPDALSGSRISVHIDFDRKLESAYSVVLPLILGFVALGVVPMLRRSNLSARTAICLAILTFAVAFPFTISSFVPQSASRATLAETGFISLLAYSVVFLITSVFASLLAKPVAHEGNLDLILDGIGSLIALLLFFLLPLVKGPSFSRTLFDLASSAWIDGLNFAWLMIGALGYGLVIRQISVFVRQYQKDATGLRSIPTRVDNAKRRDESRAWDLFICHSSEDKEEIARPLAESLRIRGLRVWYDEFTLTLGDSLSRSIDQGLAKSRFGIVILSPSFFKKEWPRRELDGLTAKEVSSGKTILPVWHRVDRDFVVKYSPVLADKLAVSTDKGLDKVVDEILKAISKDRSKAGSLVSSPAAESTRGRKALKDITSGAEVPVVRVKEEVTVRGTHLSLTLLWCKEIAICVDGPYRSGFYTFTAKPGMKFIVIAYRFQNNWKREQTTPYLKKGEITTHRGYIYSVWNPPAGVLSEEYGPRGATDEEVKNLIGTSGAFERLLPEESCVGCVAFEIPKDATPVEAVLFEVPLVFRFGK